MKVIGYPGALRPIRERGVGIQCVVQALVAPDYSPPVNY